MKFPNPHGSQSMAKHFNEEEFWERLLTGNNPAVPMRQARSFFGWFDAERRCKVCNLPFDGSSSAVLRLIWGGQSKLTPYFCSKCENFANKHLGGAEIFITMIFIDIRNSTKLAEGMAPAEYRSVVNLFYNVVSEVIVSSGGWIDKLIGDAVFGLFIPGFAGKEHAKKTILAAQRILVDLENDTNVPKTLQVGIGVHSGLVFMGAVGAEGMTDITVLGDNVNIAAHIASAAKGGEILITEDSCSAAGIDTTELSHRQLQLKGRKQTVSACVVKSKPPVFLLS
jgi:adenylate cyclase